MTREDAIKTIQELMIACTPDSKYYGVGQMAIHALEQEPMRDATPEEQKSVNDYVKSISTPTGVKFWDLEQEVTDAISRQAVDTLVDELARAISDERCCMSRGRSTATIMQDILDLPSVRPQEQTGHWIQTNEFFINQDGQFIHKFICSECKSLSYFRKSNKKAIGANVCPNCGARMAESEVEE